MRPEGHLAVLLRRLEILGEPIVHLEGALAEGSVLKEPRSLPTRSFLEQRPDPNLFRLKSLHHAAPPELSCPSASARKADHFGHRPLDLVPRNSPDSASFPDALVNLTLATERPGSSQYVVPKKDKTKATIGQRESTLGTPPVIDDAPQEDEMVDYGDGGSDSPMDDRQTTAPEFTRTSAAMSENERALCQSRLKTLFPEVERARAAVRAAEEAGEAAKETLNREREGLKLETKQMWARYEQRRALEFERVAKAIRDAKAKVRGLEEDYVSYKNRGAAAEARLRGLVDGLVQTSPPNTGQSSCDGRPSAPVSPALPGDSKEDPNILSISAELTKFRKLRELHPELSMK